MSLDLPRRCELNEVSAVFGVFSFIFTEIHNATISFTLKVLQATNQHVVKQLGKKFAMLVSVFGVRCLKSLVWRLEPMLLIHSGQSFCSVSVSFFFASLARFSSVIQRHYFLIRSISDTFIPFPRINQTNLPELKCIRYKTNNSFKFRVYFILCV